MKARYKIDQLIRTRETEEVASLTGVVTGVVHRKDSVSYEVAGQDEEVEEGDVEAVYRPVTPRKPKAVGERKPRATKKAA